MTNVADRQQVIEDLAPILPHLYQYLEAACAEAKEYFFVHEASIDGALASHIVRWNFLRMLHAEGDLLGIAHIEELGLSGISFWVRGYHLRIWKAGDEEPGTLTRFASSPSKSAFLGQQLTFWEWDQAAMVGNLVILWEVDADWHLHTVRLGPPQAVEGRFVLQWQVDVPCPVGAVGHGGLESTEAAPPPVHFECEESAIDDEQG